MTFPPGEFEFDWEAPLPPRQPPPQPGGHRPGPRELAPCQCRKSSCKICPCAAGADGEDLLCATCRAGGHHCHLAMTVGQMIRDAGAP